MQHNSKTQSRQSLISKWKTQIIGTKSCVLPRDVNTLWDRHQHFCSVGPMSSLEVGEPLPLDLTQSRGEYMHYTVVGKLRGGLLILRSQDMDISFVLARMQDSEVTVLRTIPWPLDNFRSNAGCVIPHPGEMDFLVRVSCGGEFAVISGPATKPQNPAARNSHYPQTQLLTNSQHKELRVSVAGVHGWAANFEFHPRVDSILAILHCNEPTWQCPYPRFCFSPVTLLLYDVSKQEVMRVLSGTSLAPELLSFTSDGKEICVMTAMQVKNYAVRSVSEGNTSDLLLVSSDCDDISSDDISTQLTAVMSDGFRVRSDGISISSDGNPVTSDQSSVSSEDRSDKPAVTYGDMTIVSRINASDLCEWHHVETSDHVHKSLHTSAISSLDRRSVHIMAVSTLSTSETRVFSYTRSNTRHYVDRLRHLCRMTVLSQVCHGDIDKLPLPQALKMYLTGEGK